MKKNVKLTLAVVMVVAAAFGGVKTYGAYAGASESDQLFSENIEALSDLSEWNPFRPIPGYNPPMHSGWTAYTYSCPNSPALGIGCRKGNGLYTTSCCTEKDCSGKETVVC